jgi:multiple sugar transport system substrate-binding protein
MTQYDDDAGTLGAPQSRRAFLQGGATAALGLSALGALSPASIQAARRALAANQSATAKMAVALAKKYSGKTLNFQVEAGLQAAVWKAVAKPEWEAATGTTVNIVEAPFTEQFQKLVAATQAGGFVDCAYCFCNWLPDLVSGKALVPFDPFFTKYFKTAALKRERADFVPSGITAVSKWGGKQWGFPLDAAGLVLYYRTDIFGNPKLKAAFKKQHGYDLAPPQTWQQYGEIAQFLTDRLAPKVYGALHPAGGGQAYFWFFQAYNSPEFGDSKYFDNQMNAVINGPAGVKTLDALKGYLKAGPPGANTLDPGRTWTDFVTGKLAMNVEFSPFARWASESHEKVPSFVPKSAIQGKFALAVPPGQATDVPGYTTVISATSGVKDLAFAFLAWATSPNIYSELVANPFSLVKPTRRSMFVEAQKNPLWPGQAQQYRALAATLKVLRIEPKWHAAQEYLVAVDQACTAAYTGTPTKKALDTAAKKWNDITNRVGKDLQRKAYAQYQLQVRQLRAGR